MSCDSDFEKMYLDHVGEKIRCVDLKTLQVNLGFRCNKSCSHCHLSASPNREEVMEWTTMEKILDVTSQIRPNLVDITGGAPELNPNLVPFVEALRKIDQCVQVRTNLTVLLDPEIEGLIEFYRENGVKLVASLPCYEAAEVDSIRGLGTFNESIKVLRMLNDAGYGRSGGLTLDLVYNPEGAFLPPDQSNLEESYRVRLWDDFGVFFNNLIAIANMPIGRFRGNLEKLGKFEEYMSLLRESFNPATLESLMCRHQLNIGWDGSLYDCDFNLALDITITGYPEPNVGDFVRKNLEKRLISTGFHCFGCSAGKGSSCEGSLV